MPVSAKNQFRLQGLSNELEKNVLIYLQRFNPAEISTSLRFQARVEQDILTAMQALGYYHSEVRFTLVPQRNGTLLQIDVTAGEPVRIATADILLNGEAAEDPDFIVLLQQQAPKIQQIVHQGRYDNFKSALQSLALRKGYFDANFSLARLEIAPDLNQAFVHLHFNSGPRYRFGAVTFSGQQIDSRRLQSLVPFKVGDPYLASQLGEFNQALANTDWFSSILIEGDDSQLDQQILPIDVQLAPRKRNSIETGIGYSDDVKGRFKLNWVKPWLNNRGHSLQMNLALSAAEQQIESSYKMPLVNAATDFYQFQYAFGLKDYSRQQGIRSKISNLAAERHWLLKNQWYRTVSVRLLYEETTELEQQNSSNILMPGISYNRLRQAAGYMPRSADRLLLAVEVSDKMWGSDANFVRVRGRAGWIGSVGEDHRLVTRLDAGAVVGESLKDLPLSLRFFAGGDNKLRGYGYESLPILEDPLSLAGGRYMATTSLEYQYRVRGNWWLATFADYGGAWNDKVDFKRGLGIGVRWGSPVGPIRLDFAWGLDSGERKAFQLHFSLGPEL
ncbi:autotransporter assembly complex protein TamA [Arsukibacterium sp.]|uniref:autotransporter assembly complex protein TamA n=1 Tax=Arsukibacterium sp. TaxID=1977258 RepID=UPI002FDAD0F9